ncbi:MAG: hypothetical protein ACXU95_15495 [Isosphaeraceae bacterium]
MVAYLALFVALGGSAYAASQLGKNTVGSKQLKKNAVNTAKIKKEAVTAAKVKKGTLTGAQINVSTLGAVPSAQMASALAPAEGWHVVGAPGEPGFIGAWKAESSSPTLESVAFYKDHEGIVHLRGVATGGMASGAVFQLPPSFRTASAKIFSFPVPCSGTAGTCSSINLGSIFIAGSGLSGEGELLVAPGTTELSLDSISFRAES